MAARENQGLQIALIIFVILTIMLMVATYFVFSSYSEEREKAKAATDRANTAEQNQRRAIEETENIKNVLGAGQNESLDAVQKAAHDELLTHGEGLPDSKQNYRALVEHLVAKLRKYETANTELAAQIEDLNSKLKTNDDAAQAEVAKYVAKLDETASDLESQRKTFGADRAEITSQMDSMKNKLGAIQQQSESVARQSSEQIAALESSLGRTSKLLDDLRYKEEIDQKRIEYPDGKITRVNQRSRLVWLNVGGADGLRTQTSFVVVAPEDGNPIKSTPKATIEVVRITGDHQAEARIVEDDLSHPIMIDDNIFSIVWEPGRREHFALAGKMDLNDDGRDDVQKVRDLIALNGGVIDAEVTPDGAKTGAMSIHTKYLVLGDRPEGETKDLEAFTAMMRESQQLGVKTISVQEFLRYMGYKDEHRAVNLGRFAKPSDFSPRLPGGRQRIMPGSTTPQDMRKPRTAPNGAR